MPIYIEEVTGKDANEVMERVKRAADYLARKEAERDAAMTRRCWAAMRWLLISFLSVVLLLMAIHIAIS